MQSSKHELLWQLDPGHHKMPLPDSALIQVSPTTTPALCTVHSGHQFKGSHPTCPAREFDRRPIWPLLHHNTLSSFPCPFPEAVSVCKGVPITEAERSSCSFLSGPRTSRQSCCQAGYCYHPHSCHVLTRAGERCVVGTYPLTLYPAFD